MSSLKPIVLYGHWKTPNPLKVVIILEELGLPYDVKELNLSEVKQEPYVKVNPNGRLPAIEDPNTGITLWESGAIVKYLVDTYDKDHSISYGKAPEKYYEDQWLMFQMSGQGPYYGQATWFTFFHPEKIPSALERYTKEIQRVMSVLDGALRGKKWLVGDKCTFADLSFLPWHGIVPAIWKDEKLDIAGKYPDYHRWTEEMSARPAVKRAREKEAEGIKAQEQAKAH